VTSRLRIVAALVLVLLSACGVGPEPAARRIADDEVPFALLSPSATGLAQDTSGAGVVTVFLVRGERLVAVQRRVAARPDPGVALTELAAGPTAAEAEQGLGTVSLGVPLATGEQTADRVVVDLGEDVVDVPTQLQAVAFAQVVYTLTALPGVERVAFTVAGEAVDVLRGDGSLADGPVTPADYAEFRPA
jgi:hypothetical protein